MVVAEREHAKILPWQEAFDGGVALDFAAVVPQRQAAVDGCLPCHAVLADAGDLRKSPGEGRHDDGGGVHFVHDAGGVELLSLKLSVLQMEREPFQHVGRAGIDACGRHADVHFPGGHLGEPGEPWLAALSALRDRRPLEISLCPVAGPAHRGDAQHGMGHAERRQNPLLHEVLKFSAGHFLRDDADQIVDGVVVLRLVAEWLVRLEKPDAAQIFLSGDGVVRPHGVMPGDPGAVIQHVAQCALLRGCLIIKGKPRQVVVHRPVKIQHALVDQGGDHRGAEGF